MGSVGMVLLPRGAIVRQGGVRMRVGQKTDALAAITDLAIMIS